MSNDPTRDCEHGRLKGKCEVCDLKAEAEADKVIIEYHEATIQRLQDEVVEQCRINGMSAEREEALRAEVERLNKAIAAEREACAKIADRFSIPMCDSSADDIALLIRARGNT